MIVSHSNRFVFIKTRKTAGTSIEIALSCTVGRRDIVTRITEADEMLRRQLGGRGPQNTLPPLSRWSLREWARLVRRRRIPKFYNHMPATEVRRFLPRAWDTYFTFSIDRNPWDLAVSAWWWERGYGGSPLSFEQFVNSNALIGYSNWDLYTADGEVIVDRLIRFDTLEEDFRRIQGHLELPAVELPKAKAGFRTDERHYQDWYDRHLQLRVAEVFESEIDYFGWKFE